MDRMLLYIPSYNDSELVRQSLATVPDWEVVISDNASDEPHAAALAALGSERVAVIRQETSLGRVGNWEFCVRHFAESGARWMKFLLAGDRHKPNSLALCRRVVAQYPDTRFFVFNIDTIWPQGAVPWTNADQPLRLAPAQLMAEIALRGNVFYGMITALIHV